MNADSRHAAVMAAVLKSSVWLMLPTVLHLLQAGRPVQMVDYLALAIALGQLFWAWRCVLDAYLFAALAAGRLDERALDEMLGFLFGRSASPSPSMMQRLAGARRLWWRFLLLTASYWLLVAAVP